MNVIARSSVFAALAVCLAGPVSAQDQAAARLEAEQADLVTALTGRWVNELQVFFADDAGIAPEDTPVRQDWTFQPTEEPGVLEVVGEGAVFATMTFTPDLAAGVVRSTATNAPEGCQLAWRRQAGAFIGAAEGPCGETGVRRLTVNGEFLRLDRQDGGPAFEMRRARAFSCWAAVLRGAEHGDSGDGETDWWFTRDVALHDQGDVATLTTDEDPPRMIDLRMRRVEWPSGPNRPSLSLYVHADQAERATSYAWGAYDATRIGMNLRWLQASCTHVPDDKG